MRLLTGLMLVLSLGLTNISNAAPRYTKHPRCKSSKTAVIFYRSATWKWQDSLNVSRTNTSYSERWSKSCVYTAWVAGLWQTRSYRLRLRFNTEMVRRRSYYVSLSNKWDCIHRNEGAWNSNTGNGYYGGLQMDLAFQRTYGSEFLARYGTANNWPIGVQLLVAERAYDGYNGESARGFDPWPNTARACGLL